MKELELQIDGFQSEEGASKEALSQLSKLNLPSDYLAFLAETSGGEGFVGEQYLILWRAEEIIEFNEDYQVDKYAPGIILFASDGGGEGFGFDTKASPPPVVKIPFVGMSRESAIKVAESFTHLIEKMRDPNARFC